MSENKQQEHALDATARDYIAELHRQQQQVIQQVVQNTKVALTTTLELEVRRAGLEGNWQLAEDGTKLIRIDLAPTTSEVTQ